MTVPRRKRLTLERFERAFLDADGRMQGSLMIVEAESLEVARAFHAADPYNQAGLFERSEVRP